MVVDGQVGMVSLVSDSGEVFTSACPGPVTRFVVLPLLGESVDLGAEEPDLWLGVDGLDAGAVSGVVEVAVLRAGTVLWLSVALSDVDAREKVRGEVAPQVKTVASALWLEIMERRAGQRSHEEWRRVLNAEANRWADDNDLCGRFDEFMSAHGLEPREREWEVRVCIDDSFLTTRDARTAEDACEQVSVEDVVEMLRDGLLTFTVDPD